MNRTIEGVLRFVNLTTSGLLAGSLGFGEAALVPGWHHELPREKAAPIDTLKRTYYFNAIGRITDGRRVLLNGQPLEPRGWDHFSRDGGRD